MHRKLAAAAILSGCLLLCGCASLLEREYSTVEEHSSKYWESESADILRAENYQDIVNDLMLLIGQHTENVILRLYNYEGDATVSSLLENAAAEVQQDTPLGAYAVEYITSEAQLQRSYYEITLRISYRRSAEQIRSVVNATTASALPELLENALQAGKDELAVRISYWGSDSAETVQAAVRTVREAHGLTKEDAPWTVTLYPREDAAGLVEFLFSPSGEEVMQTAPAEKS